MRFDKILTTVGFGFIAATLVTIANTPPAAGWEVSIYSAYPAYFWFFLIASIACGIGILVHQAFAERKSNWWIAGLSVIIFANCIFLFLPAFRGYAIYGRADTLTHIGWIADIVSTSHVSETDIYPTVHVIGADFMHMSGLSPALVTNLLFALFSCLYTANVYLLARAVARNHGQALLVTAFATPLIFSFLQAHIQPAFFSLFMVPLLLYFYHRASASSTRKPRDMALLLLLAISTSLFHPTTALFTIAALLLFGITPLLYRQFAAARASGTFSTMGENMTRVALLTSLIMILFFSTWYFSTGAVQNQFGKITDWLAYEITTGSDYVPSSVAAPAGFTPDGAAPGGSTSGESTPSQGPIPSSMFQRLMYALSKADLTPSQTTELFINRYGAIFLYLIIAGILAITALGRFLFRKKTSDPMSFTYSLQFLLALAISAFMLFVYAPEADELRIVRFPLFMGTVLSGLMVYDFIASYPRENHSRARLLSRRTVLATTTGMVIITAAALSIGSVYGDYRTARQHQQVTHTEFAGIEWFQELGNHEVPIITNSPMQLWRFQHYYGVDSPGRSMPKINFAQLPSHFGYDEHVNIAEALSLQDEYIAILPPDRIAPLVRRTPGFAQWTKEDFIKLNSDPTTNKVYSNGEFEVWRVYNNQR